MDDLEFEDCFVASECNATESDSMPPDAYVVDNYTIIAHSSDLDDNGRYRKFTVSLYNDGNWSFEFTNGLALTEEQKQTYCNEIAGAQSLLETKRRWYLRGRGIGVWDYHHNSSGGSDGAIEDHNTRYYPNGTLNGSRQECNISSRADLDVRPARPLR